jgi:hypothetical protein
MSDAPRSPLDILEDIDVNIRAYPPLRESRPHLYINVADDGAVTFTGNVRSGIIKRVLVDSTAQIPGVTGVDATALYDDDALLVAVGRVMPPGVYLTAVNGTVALSGSLRDPDAIAAAVAAAKAVPGVRVAKPAFIGVGAAVAQPAAI